MTANAHQPTWPNRLSVLLLLSGALCPARPASAQPEPGPLPTPPRSDEKRLESFLKAAEVPPIDPDKIEAL